VQARLAGESWIRNLKRFAASAINEAEERAGDSGDE